MKTTVLSVLVLLACMGTAKSQVGINQKQPKATLDVMASNEIAIPDGVLVPRMPLSLLKSKNNAYSTDQHGALIYVTEIDESPYGKTIDVKKPGFYYYNSTTSKWDAVAGNSVAPSKIQYQNIIGSSYTLTGEEDIIIFLGSGQHTLKYNSARYNNVMLGKKIQIYVDNNLGQVNLTDGVGTPRGNGVKGETLLNAWSGVVTTLTYVGYGGDGGFPDQPWIVTGGY